MDVLEQMRRLDCQAETFGQRFQPKYNTELDVGAQGPPAGVASG